MAWKCCFLFSRIGKLQVLFGDGRRANERILETKSSSARPHKMTCSRKICYLIKMKTWRVKRHGFVLLDLSLHAYQAFPAQGICNQVITWIGSCTQEGTAYPLRHSSRCRSATEIFDYIRVNRVSGTYPVDVAPFHEEVLCPKEAMQNFNRNVSPWNFSILLVTGAYLNFWRKMLLSFLDSMFPSPIFSEIWVQYLLNTQSGTKEWGELAMTMWGSAKQNFGLRI